MRAWFPLVMDFDPAPVWAKVRIPVLNSMGELDRNVRVADTVPIMKEAAKTSGNRDFTITVYPGADHGILVTSKMGRPHLADGFMEAMTKWLLAHV
jgi:dienelactone hydrolase